MKTEQEVSEILQAANLALVRSLSLDAVLQVLLDFLARLVPYDSANVMLVEGDSRLRVKASRGYERWSGTEPIQSVSFDSKNSPIWSAMLASRESLLISDTDRHPDWERPAASAHVRSWMGVPLASAGEIIGFYSIDKAEPGFFTPEHLRLTESLAPQAAAAIRNALLFEQVQANEARLRQTVEALRLSEDRFARAFRASPAAMSISTLADGRYVDGNDRFLQLIGYSREEVIGRTGLELGFWADPDDRAQVIEILRENGTLRDLEVRVHTKSGEVRDVLLSLELVDLDGVPCLLGLSQDVTDRKRLENQLRQAHKLEAVGRLAGGVAHDFNNLMTAILGYSDLLLKRFGENDPSRRFVLEISRAGGRVASLTRQLLAFGRKQVLVPQVLDLNALLAGSEDKLHGLLGPSVVLGTSLEPDLGRVRADPAQIQQVLVNLVVNARDAMPEGGRLTIATRDAPSGEPDFQGPHVVLTVSDTGVGMDEETRSHLFEPYFTTKERAKAAGLGLATVYGIVKQTGGHVGVRSEPGHGTTFSVYLPRIEAPSASAAESARAESAAGGAETILLVEDEAQVRHLAREILETAGYRVLEAASGAEALRVADAYQDAIDLMLTDVVMPGMSGRELAERLTPLRSAMKILFTSGHTDDAIVQHGVLDPDVPFLPKPFTPVELTSKVRELLGRA